MKNIRKKIIAILAIMAMVTIFQTNVSNAVVESRPDSASLVNKTPSEFFALIRKMETADGPMGLNATVDDTGTETSSSNNIDAHMIKNTEYGTVGMLAASIYGAKDGDGERDGNTTGNATGVYEMGNIRDRCVEFVAGIFQDTTVPNLINIKNAQQKYWDNYTNIELPKPGDGTKEIPWRYSWGNEWVDISRPIFERGREDGIFEIHSDEGAMSNIDTSRAVVVSGIGF